MKRSKLHPSITSNPMFTYLVLLAVSSTIAFQGWRTLFNNFAVNEVGITGLEVGVIQSIREIPGFLALLVIYLLLIFREHRLAALSVILLGIGVGAAGFLPSFEGLIFTTFLFSVGFHYFETTNQSLTLQYFSHKDSPHVFARIKSIMAITNVAVGAAVWFLSGYLSFQSNFLLLGLLTITIASICLFKDPTHKDIPVQHKKMVFRKKYWLFYVLNLLSGSRRQIFVVFAVFMLVEKFNYSIKEIALLFILNNVISYFFNPLIAKGINRFGERKVLSFEYFNLIWIFIGYAFVTEKWMVGALYILDHIFFNFSIAIRTYFQKNADPKDIAPSMAVGFTINHVAAVIVPVIGGTLWMLHWQIPFFVGAGLSVVSLIFANKIKN